MILPSDAAERKAIPLARGLLYYFPNALAAVATVSAAGNTQHNGNEELHWAMEKSTDHADCIMRHLADAGTRDTDGMRHSAKVAWRALALLESECIAEGAKPGRNAIRAPSPDYDPASVAFRHGDLESVCGCAISFAQTGVNAKDISHAASLTKRGLLDEAARVRKAMSDDLKKRRGHV